MTEKELLIKAAEYIQKHGWLKEDLGKINGPVCMLGALRCAAGFDPEEPIDDVDYGKSYWALPPNTVVYLNAVNRLEAELSSPIPNWNDSPNTTVEDVINRLLKLAESILEE